MRPGTGDPVPEGEVGEVVVTTFNPDYPLISVDLSSNDFEIEGISVGVLRRHTHG